jgi:flagellin-like hook-associated protein FlgL
MGQLHEAREHAARIGLRIEQVQTASEGVSWVQALVAQLGDIAVVGLDRALPPSQRAALQRQVDQTLQEIDTVSGDTPVDDSMLRGRFVADVRGEQAALTPFRDISAAALGLDGLAVRSTDQALAASGALDLAATRLQRTGRLLASASDRLQDALIGLTSPTTTATGEPALGSASTALGSSMLLRNQLLGSPDQSVQAQSGLDAARVRRLLDTSSQ